MNFHEIKLMEVVSNTCTGVEGKVLKREIEAHIRINQGITVNMKGHGFISPSFIRASFGYLLKRYGEEPLLKYLILSNYHLSAEELLREAKEDLKWSVK